MINRCPHRKQSLEQKHFCHKEIALIARLVAFRQICQNCQLCDGHFYKLMQLQLLQMTNL